MKLPSIGRGQVESLAQENVQAAAAEGAGVFNTIAQAAGTAAKVSDDFQLIREQESSLALYKQEKDKRRQITSAIDPVSGKVNIDALPDELRDSYMLSDAAETTGGFNDDEFIDDQRVAALHKVQPFLDQYFKDSEANANASIKTYREQGLYRTRDNGEAEKFREQLELQAKKSVIESTVNMAIEEMGDAAIDGDVAAVKGQAAFLADSGYLDPQKAKALESQNLDIIKLQVEGDLLEMQAEDSSAAFEGLEADVKLGKRLYTDKVNEAVEDGLITKEEAEVTLYKYDLEIATQEAMGTLKDLYDNKGRQTAIDNVDVLLRQKGDPFEQRDRFKMSKQINEYFNLLDRNFRVKTGAANKETFDFIKGYVSIVSRGGEPEFKDIVGQEATRAYLDERIKALPPEDQDKYTRMLDMADKAKRLMYLPTDEFNEAIELELNKSTTDLRDYKEAQQLQQIAADRNKAIKDDPLGFYMRYLENTGGINPEFVEFNMADPVGSMLRLSDRAREATEFTGVLTSPLPVGIAKQLSEGIKTNQIGYDMQLAFMQGIAALPDDQALGMAKTFFDTDNYSMGVGALLIRDGVSPNGLLQGSAVLRADPSILPKSIAGEGTLQGALIDADIYAATAGMPQLQQAYIEAIKSQLVWENGLQPITTYDQSMIQKAADIVTGGTVGVGSDNLPTIAPFYGASEAQFDDGVNRMTMGDLDAMGIGDRIDLTDVEVLEKIKRESRWIPLTNGRYHIQITSVQTGEQMVLKNKNGSAFVLDWSMIGSAPKEADPNPAASRINDVNFGAL